MDKAKNYNKEDRKPNHQFRIRTSKDGRHIMFDDIKTWIFPIQYLEKIIANAGKSSLTQNPGADKNKTKTTEA